MFFLVESLTELQRRRDELAAARRHFEQRQADERRSELRMARQTTFRSSTPARLGVAAVVGGMSMFLWDAAATGVEAAAALKADGFLQSGYPLGELLSKLLTAADGVPFVWAAAALTAGLLLCLWSIAAGRGRRFGVFGVTLTVLGFAIAPAVMVGAAWVQAGLL